MIKQPPPDEVLGRPASLFTPGPRLGWVFRDHRQLAAAFPEAPPELESMQAAAAQSARAARAGYLKTRKYLGRPSALLLLVLLLADGCRANLGGTSPLGADLVALLICSPGIVLTAVKWQRSRPAAARSDRFSEDYQQALARWQERAAGWQQAELARLQDAYEWGSAVLPAGTRRADVFGGSWSGWQALVTTHGTSVLASQPLLMLDLTGELIGTELGRTARAAGVPAVSWLLPADLASCGLLAGLGAAQFAEAFAEAVHAGEASTRGERAVDTRVLEQLHGALGTEVTLPRLAAAARAGLGQADSAGLLTRAEQSVIAGDLFPAGDRRQIEPNLLRIEALLADLARPADQPDQLAGPPAGPAYLTQLALAPAARSARVEVLAVLVIQWLTVQVTRSDNPAPAVIISGADEISLSHLDRLASACERRGVPLTLLFRHLRDRALAVLGGGATGFMRLGNHAEAEQAARYIGRPQAVAPAVLQHLPDQAMLLVTSGPAGPVLQQVECDPAISTRPRVSTRPLPDPAETGRAAAARPARGEVAGSGQPRPALGQSEPKGLPLGGD